MPRFFVKPEQINENMITIIGEDAKHITSVLRCKIDEKITVCDGCGNDYDCSIVEIVGNEVNVNIISENISCSEPNTKVTLFQGLPKSDKMELIIQKCVELGVDRIVPVNTARAIVKFDKKDKESKKLERWQKISEAAAKQSGRGKIPPICPVMTFDEAVKEAKTMDGSIIPYENEQFNNIKEFVKKHSGVSIGIFIGPEGGFEEYEITQAINNGILPITLGKRILRTETAGLVSLAILIYELG